MFKTMLFAMIFVPTHVTIAAKRPCEFNKYQSYKNREEPSIDSVSSHR